MKASRDMNPRCGEGAGVAAAPGDGADGIGLEPGGSSAIILRIEARISSMLGSALDSSLDIPHLLATDTPVLRSSGFRSLSRCRSDPRPNGMDRLRYPIWWQVAEKPATTPISVIPGARRSQGDDGPL